MLNAHIGAIYFCKYTKKNQKKWFCGWILFAGLTWFNFICMQGDNEDVFSVILGSKYIVSLHLILNLNFNLTFCNLLFFSIISNAISSFLCTAFLGICLSACFGNIVDFQNIITDFAHNIHKIITCKKTMNISSQLHYHDWMIGKICRF